MDRRDRSRGNFNERIDLESRTPLAWQHRDMNYHPGTFHERYPEVPASNSDRYSHPSIGSRSARSANRKIPEREMNPRSSNNKPLSSIHGHHNSGFRNSDPVHPSSEETTTGSSSETETDSQAERAQRSRPGTSGTLRSMQSMPLLSPLQNPFNPVVGGIYGVGMVGMLPPHTWNGEPCPVHGASLPQAAHLPMSITPYPGYPPIYSSMSMRRAASMHELAMTTPLPALMPPPQPIYGTLPGPSSQMAHLPPHTPTPGNQPFMVMGPSSLGLPHPSMGRIRIPPSRQAAPSLPPMPPPSLLPPLQRRPMVVNEKNGHPEPLPVREAPPLPPKVPPSDAASKSISKSSVKPLSYDACCRGNIIVLWVILSVIAFGIILGIVFHYAFP